MLRTGEVIRIKENLKVGDRVEVTQLYAHDRDQGICIGDIGTVVRACDIGCRVKFDKRDGSYLIQDYQLRKVEENKMEFSKKDLKSGMVVELRDGSRFLTVEINGRLDLIGKDTWDSLSLYNENLTDADRDFDIVKVYETYPRPFGRMLKGGILIWERKEPKEMTIDDIEKELGYPVKIVKE